MKTIIKWEEVMMVALGIYLFDQLDRARWYGLTYGQDFKYTHLREIGK